MTDTDTDTDTAGDVVGEVAPRAPVEFRRAGDFEVHFAQRTIDLVAVPWNVEVVVEYPPRSGRSVVEAGAFDGVERRANRVKVNREHDETRTVGRAAALHPSRAEGLIAELRISKTPLGDETLELAADGVLEPSVGMAVAPSWQRWANNRSRRRIVKAFLEHIAMLPDGAYGEAGAQVLDVRDGVAAPGWFATPNIDDVMAWIRGQHAGGS
jgi:hypothetical protein